MQILNSAQIQQKIRRLAIEILENNYTEKELIFIGINNKGTGFAKLLINELQELTDIKLHLCSVRLNPAEPTKHPVELGIPAKNCQKKALIIVDDVANTGRTIFYAIKPLMDILPKKVEVAVLVDRKHKSFPIKVDYMGLSLATTLKEHIEVKIERKKDYAVFLE